MNFILKHNGPWVLTFHRWWWNVQLLNLSLLLILSHHAFGLLINPTWVLVDEPTFVLLVENIMSPTAAGIHSLQVLLLICLLNSLFFFFFFLFHKKGKDKVFCKNILGIAEFCILKNPLKFSLNCSVHFVNHFLFYFIKHTWSLNSVLTLHSICF